MPLKVASSFSTSNRIPENSFFRRSFSRFTLARGKELGKPDAVYASLPSSSLMRTATPNSGLLEFATRRASE